MYSYLQSTVWYMKTRDMYSVVLEGDQGLNQNKENSKSSFFLTSLDKSLEHSFSDNRDRRIPILSKA